jgi:hypothetical protein
MVSVASKLLEMAAAREREREWARETSKTIQEEDGDYSDGLVG